jgi:hypothetical protein
VRQSRRTTRCSARRIRSSMLWTTRARSPLIWIGPSWAEPMARMQRMRPSFWEMNISTSLSAAPPSGSRERTSRTCPVLASFAPPSRELRTLTWTSACARACRREGPYRFTEKRSKTLGRAARPLSTMRADRLGRAVRQSPQKAAHQPGHTARGLIEREMSGVQQMHLRLRHVFPERSDLGNIEHRVVAAPDDQGGRPAFA